MPKETDILLTTKDNEFNPFTDYDNWKAFDTAYEHPYCTEEYVAREVGFLDEEMSESEVARALNRAYDTIIALNKEIGYYIYIKVSRDGSRFETTPTQD